MNTLALSPGELRLGAMTLGQQAALLGAAGAAPSGAAAGWSGLAALQQQAREEEWARMLCALDDPLEELAGLVAGFADQVEDSQQTIRHWLTRGAEAAREEADLQRLVALADELTRPPLERRLQDARWLVDQARQRVAQVEEELRQRAEQLAARVADSWPVRLLRELAWIRDVGQATIDLYSTGRMLAPISAVVQHAVAAARATDVQARALLQGRMSQAVLALQRSFLPAGRLMRFLPVLSGPVGTTLSYSISGAADLFTGGGYTGWRGGVTRVLGGLAVPASIALWFPPATFVSAAVLGTYTAWTAGNVIVDNRHNIARFGRQAAQAARLAATALDRRYQINERLKAGAEAARDMGEDYLRHVNPMPDLDDEPDVPITIPGVPVPIWVELPEIDLPELNPPVPITMPWEWDLDLPKVGVPDLDLPTLDFPGPIDAPWDVDLPDLPDLPDGPDLPDLPRLPWRGVTDAVGVP